VRELIDSDFIFQLGTEFIKDDLEMTLGIEFKNRCSVNPLDET
jgi:hypothetical protein